MTVPAYPARPRAHSARGLSRCALLAAILSSSAIAQVQGPPGDLVTPGGKTKTPPPVRLEHVASWGGPVNCFARQGSIGVVGSGERLVVLDMSDPMHFVELGAVRLGSPVMDVAFKDGFAYVMTAGVDWLGPENHLGRRGPHVIDVRNPEAPVRVWSNEPNGFRYQWAEVDLYSNANGDMAIIRHDDHGLYLMEISDPLNPVTYSGSNWRLQDATGSLVLPNEIVVQGDLMFVAAINRSGQPAAFHVYDLSAIDPDVRPIIPPRLASINFGQPGEEKLEHIAVDGDRAYVTRYKIADRTNHVVAIDIAVPDTPAISGEYGDFPLCNIPWLDIEATNGLVYATYPANSPYLADFDVAPGLVILDMLTNPSNPAMIGDYHGRTAAFAGLRAEGDTVFLFDRGEGLVSLDTSNPANPVRRGGYYSPAALRQMEKRGDLLYISDCWNGLTILDVSDPMSAQVVGAYQPEGVNNWGLDVLDNGLAYLCTHHSGFEVVDVSDPASPQLVGAVREPPYWEFHTPANGFYGIKVIDGVAYVGAFVGIPGFGEMRVFNFDVADPTSIVPIDPDGVNITFGQLYALSFEHDAQRGLLFATGEPGARHGLEVLDINDPSDLHAWGDLGLDNSGYLVASSLDADRGVLATVDGRGSGENAKFSLLDVTDPYAPDVLSEIAMNAPGAVTRHPLGTLVVGSAPAIAPDGWNRVLLLDTSNPSLPALVTSAPVPTGSPATHQSQPGTHILADGSDIYVASGYGFDAAMVGISNTSRNYGLAIFSIQGGAGRSRDRNGDGRLDTRDFLALVSDVQAGRASADLNGDGSTDSLDLQAFLRDFAQDCGQ